MIDIYAPNPDIVAGRLLENSLLDTTELSIFSNRGFLGHAIVVVYTYRGEDFRLISAKPATRTERNVYEIRTS